MSSTKCEKRLLEGGKPTNIFSNITEINLIQHEMHSAFQQIYQKQDNIYTSPDALKNFLNSNNDMEHSMEGLLTLNEVTHSLFKVVCDASSPGVDGFTVNHLRTFWYYLTHDILNCSFGSLYCLLTS